MTPFNVILFNDFETLDVCMTDPNLTSRINDLARQSLSKGLAHSKFLTPSECEEVRLLFQNRRDVNCIIDGGIEEAERSVAVFVNPDWGAYERESVIAALAITIRKQDSLNHRDILGATLGLGIERSLLGDIVIGEPNYLICLANMAEFICDNLTKAGRVGLTLKRVRLSELPKSSHILEEKTDTVASLRLDAVLASMFSLSRAVAAEYITQGKVQVAHKVCEDTSKLVSEGVIISTRGLGRGKLLELGGQSRKGRIWIRYGIYV